MYIRIEREDWMRGLVHQTRKPLPRHEATIRLYDDHHPKVRQASYRYEDETRRNARYYNDYYLCARRNTLHDTLTRESSHIRDRCIRTPLLSHAALQ